MHLLPIILKCYVCIQMKQVLSKNAVISACKTCRSTSGLHCKIYIPSPPLTITGIEAEIDVQKAYSFLARGEGIRSWKIWKS